MEIEENERFKDFVRFSKFDIPPVGSRKKLKDFREDWSCTTVGKKEKSLVCMFFYFLGESINNHLFFEESQKFLLKSCQKYYWL